MLYFFLQSFIPLIIYLLTSELYNIYSALFAVYVESEAEGSGDEEQNENGGEGFHLSYAG
jgi:hypothetical protein